MKLKNSRVYVAGHNGLVGRAICRMLGQKPIGELITIDRKDLDLTDNSRVYTFLKETRPDVVIVAAAKVGGILANSTQRSEFIRENLAIQDSLIWNSHLLDINSLVFLGSSCIYPKNSPQPIREEYLLDGPLEVTNRPYALAKIAGVELVSCLATQYKRDYFSVMPTNLYGPFDNFNLNTSHVLPALLLKFVEAKRLNHKSVAIWGSGKPLREFMYVDDCADAILHLLEHHKLISGRGLSDFGHWNHINIGSGFEISICNLAQKIKDIVGFEGRIEYDNSKPDGTMRKRLDVTLLEGVGWKPKIDLDIGIKKTMAWLLQNTSSHSINVSRKSKFGKESGNLIDL